MLHRRASWYVGEKLWKVCVSYFNNDKLINALYARITSTPFCWLIHEAEILEPHLARALFLKAQLFTTSFLPCFRDCFFFAPASADARSRTRWMVSLQRHSLCFLPCSVSLWPSGLLIEMDWPMRPVVRMKTGLFSFSFFFLFPEQF